MNTDPQPIELKPLELEYDDLNDVLTVDGFRYSGALFRGLSLQTAADEGLQVIMAEDGIVTIRQFKLPGGFDPSAPDEFSTVLGEWQACPVCLGSGGRDRPPDPNSTGIQPAREVCNACDGRGMVARPRGQA